MVDVIETGEKFILVCNYKRELFILDDLVSNSFPNATYSQGQYQDKSAIYLNRDSHIPKEYQNSNNLKYFIDTHISRMVS